MSTLHEVGAYPHSFSQGDRKFLLVHPNLYRSGAASLGMLTLYNRINGLEGSFCDRAYFDIVKPVESGFQPKKADIIGFSIHYELDYFNAIFMIREYGMDPRSENRKKEDPLLIAGGTCAYNPAPLSEIFDAFVVGDAEESIVEIINTYDPKKRNIEDLESIRGVYLSKINNNTEKRTINDLNSVEYPIYQPFSPHQPHAYKNAFLLEIARGCGLSCRFCLYDHISRPPRFRNLEKLRDIIDLTGRSRDTYALISASVLLHPEIEDILGFIMQKGKKAILPSLRADHLHEELVPLIEKLGIRNLTFAPETPITSLRNCLNKKIDEDRFIENIKNLKNTIRKIKLYFMTGLPGERFEDLGSIAEYVSNLKKIVPTISVSITPFVPKPHTPLQYAPFCGREYAERAYRYLKSKLGGMCKLKFESPRMTEVQAVLSRGDKDLSEPIMASSNPKEFIKNLRKSKVDPDRYLGGFDPEEQLPWGVIQTGISNEHLKSEYLRSKEAIGSRDDT